MNKLLADIIGAHGGIDRWNAYEKVEATIVSGGGLFPLKGLIQDPNPRRMTVWLHEERSSVLPYGAPDQRTMFTPDVAADLLRPAMDETNLVERQYPAAFRDPSRLRDHHAGRRIDRHRRKLGHGS